LGHDAFNRCVRKARERECFGVTDTARVVEAALPVWSEPSVFDDDRACLLVCNAFDASRFVTNEFPSVTPIRQALFRMDRGEREERFVVDDRVCGAEEARVQADDDARPSLPHH
jgi:hypothetical protein